MNEKESAGRSDNNGTRTTPGGGQAGIGQKSQGSIRMDGPRLVGVDKLAEICDIKVSWIYQHIAELPHCKFGNLLRFDPDKVIEAMSRGARKRMGPLVY